MPDIHPNELWNGALDLARHVRDLTPIRGLLNDSAGMELAGAVLRVATNQFCFDYMKKRPEIQSKFSRYASEVLGRDCTVVFAVDDEFLKQVAPVQPESDRLHAEPEQIGEPAVPLPATNSQYLPESMGTFIVQERNRVPYGMRMVLLGDDTPTRRMIFLGDPATGKTHLASDLCHLWEKSHPGRVVYISAWHYMDVFRKAASQRCWDAFNDLNGLIAEASLVVLDDIHVLFQKEGKIQDQIETAYNALRVDARVLLVTNVPVEQWKMKSKGLRSRILGLCPVAFPEPDAELRMAVAEAKARELGVALEGEIIDLIASRLDLDLRSIDGLLHSAKTRILAGCTPDIGLVNDLLMRSDRPKLNPQEAFEGIVRNVISVMRETENEVEIAHWYDRLRSGDQRAEVANLRHLAIYVLKEVLPDLTHEKLASLFRRERTTASNSLEKAAQFLNDTERWPDLPAQINEIKRRLAVSAP